MEHPKTDAHPTIDLSHTDIDPWDEFLSESSDELQALESGTASGDVAPARDDAPTFERVGMPPSTSVTRDVEPPAADVVRVSIAPSPVELPLAVPPVTPDVSSDRVAAIDSSPALTEQERLDRLRSLAPFAIRRESRELSAPAEPRPPVDRPTSAQVLSPSFGHASPSVSEPARVVKEPELDPSPPIVSRPLPVRPPEMARPPATPALIANSFSLREVLARQTPVQWSEAVAVVEELCGELSAVSQSTIPDLADVVITREGRVVVRPGAVGDPDIATLGRTLHTLLASATPPLPLRLFVTSSISSDRFKSIALYADALSYYGTPRRAELIRALYERAAQSVAPVMPHVEARAQSRPLEKVVVPAERGRRSPALLWTMAVLVGGVIGTGVALVMWPSTPEVTASLKPTAPSAPVAPHDDWQLGSLTVNETFSKKHPGRATRAGSSRADAAPKSTGAAAPVATKAPVASSPSSSSPVPASGVPPADAGSPPASTPPARSSSTPPPEAHVPAVAPPSAPVAALTAPAPVDPTVYSEQDRDVTPPVMLTKLPPPSAFNSPTDSQVSSTLELVVNPKGQVVTAKYVDRPTRLPDVAKLQEAKGWQFTPAMKDGHPVSYRYFLRTTTSPR